MNSQPGRSILKHAARSGATLVALCVLLGGAIACATNEAGPAYRRWAILASKEVRASGLDDLLAVRLSQSPELELVDRSELERLTDELELDAVLGPPGREKRLQLGRLLPADALALLSLEQRDEGRVLQLIVSECRYGARLGEECRYLDQAQPDQAVEWLAAG